MDLGTSHLLWCQKLLGQSVLWQLLVLKSKKRQRETKSPLCLLSLFPCLFITKVVKSRTWTSNPGPAPRSGFHHPELLVLINSNISLLLNCSFTLPPPTWPAVWDVTWPWWCLRTQSWMEIVTKKKTTQAILLFCRLYWHWRSGKITRTCEVCLINSWAHQIL